MTGPAGAPTGPRPAVFLDRDGTLVEERHYPVREQDLVPVPGAAGALRRLHQAGYLVLLLTNQSAVARGMLDEERLGALHADLLGRLASDGGVIDDVFYCPHHPEGTALAYAFPCDCRKPAPGLLHRAMARHDIDLSRSAFIGDSPRDLFPGVEGAGARILVRSGHPLEDVSAADQVAPDFPAAVDWLLAQSRTPPDTPATSAQGT